MQLSDVLRFDEAESTGYDYQPNDNGGKGILHVTAPLTRANATALNAAFLFVTDTVPHEGAALKSVKLEKVDLEIGRSDNDVRRFSPEVITSVNTKAVEDLGLEISFNAHFVGDDDVAMQALARSLNKAKFNCVVRPVVPTQTGPLFQQNGESPSEPPEADQELGEKRFDRTPDGAIKVRHDGKKSVAVITAEPCEGGYRAGYGASFSFRMAKEIKADPSEMIAFGSEREAIGAAAAKVHEWARKVQVGAAGGEKAAAVEMAKWCEQFMERDQFITPEPAGDEAVEEEEQPVDA